MPAAQFIQLARACKAHSRTVVTRTWKEGDAVNWQAVVADAVGKGTYGL